MFLWWYHVSLIFNISWSLVLSSLLKKSVLLIGFGRETLYYSPVRSSAFFIPCLWIYLLYNSNSLFWGILKIGASLNSANIGWVIIASGLLFLESAEFSSLCGFSSSCRVKPALTGPNHGFECAIKPHSVEVVHGLIAKIHKQGISSIAWISYLMESIKQLVGLHPVGLSFQEPYWFYQLSAHQSWSTSQYSREGEKEVGLIGSVLHNWGPRHSYTGFYFLQWEKAQP